MVNFNKKKRKKEREIMINTNLKFQFFFRMYKLLVDLKISSQFQNLYYSTMRTKILLIKFILTAI